MGETKVNLTSLIRLSIVVFLCIIIFLIGWNFITQSKKKTKVPVEIEKITPRKVEMREKIEHFEVKGDRGNFKIRADKNYIGEDNQYHLEGNVELTFFKKKEGKDVFLYGQEIVYDEDWNHFLLRGEARVKFKDILIESSALNYESKTEMFQSDKGVRFTSDSLSGTARMMVYSTKGQERKARHHGGAGTSDSWKEPGLG